MQIKAKTASAKRQDRPGAPELTNSPPWILNFTLLFLSSELLTNEVIRFNQQLMGEISLQIEELLNKLTREELIQINRAVLRRVKVMDDLRRLQANAAFYPGDKVSWFDRDGQRRAGMVIRVNTKTISVEEDSDPEGIWRIPASLLNMLP